MQGDGIKAVNMDTPSLVAPVIMTIEEMLGSDPRMFPPVHTVKEIYFALNADIQIKLTNGETVMIYKKAEGTLTKTGELDPTHPIMMGVINIKDK